MEDDILVDSSQGEISGLDDSGNDNVSVTDNSNGEDDSGSTSYVQVESDSVIPIYTSTEDDLGNPVAYAVDVLGDSLSDSGETQESVDDPTFTDNDILFQLNQNLVDTASVNTALVGLLIGFFSAVELLKIWLQS